MWEMSGGGDSVIYKFAEEVSTSDSLERGATEVRYQKVSLGSTSSCTLGLKAPVLTCIGAC